MGKKKAKPRGGAKRRPKGPQPKLLVQNRVAKPFQFEPLRLYELREWAWRRVEEYAEAHSCWAHEATPDAVERWLRGHREKFDYMPLRRQVAMVRSQSRRVSTQDFCEDWG